MHPVTDPAVIDGYLVDASNVRGHATALFRPRSAAEVAEVLARATAEGVPVTVTARRTSTTAAPVPAGGWLLSTEHLDQLHALDDADAGVLLGAAQAEIERAGRFFPPDPTSRHECTLGGAIACNASGARSFAYGPTRPWITWAEVVWPDGRIERVDRRSPLPSAWPRPGGALPPVKSAAGFFPADNLLDLLIGSEGTLGVVTRAGLRLTALPVGVLSLFAFFASTEALLGFVAAARAGARRPAQPTAAPGALAPRALEYFDRHALDLVRARVPDIPAAATDGLFVEIEHGGEAPLEAWWEALEAHGALVDATIVAEDPAGRARLQAVRHAVPAGINEIVVRNGMPKLGTDLSVPDDALPEMMAAYRAVPLRSVLFGHIGDSHLHLNLLPASPAELAQARAAYDALADRAIALGGSVSAEHGIGKTKRHHLARMVGPAVLASWRALKAAVDPAGILGRGTLFLDEGPA